MKEFNKIDLGSVKVHKKVLAEITLSAVQEIKGVSLVTRDFSGLLGKLTGNLVQPGITVCVDSNNQVTIEVRVNVRYGLNIPEVARQVQDVVRAAIEKTVDIDLKVVNVNIQGVERGEA